MIKFMTVRGEENSDLAIELLRGEDQNVTFLENEERAFSMFREKDDILVGIFLSPNPKLLRRGHRSRVASHRVMPYAPGWARPCQLLIALSPRFKEGDNIKETVREWIRIVNEFKSVNLIKAAPWGPLPTGLSGFLLYEYWLKNSAGLNLDELGLNFMPPRSNLSHKQVKIIRDALKGRKDKGLTDRVIRTAQQTPCGVNMDCILTVGAKLIDLAKEKRIMLESGIQFEHVLNGLWRANSGENLQIIIPMCPAWTYNESGYTFRGLEENSRGICYEMMLPELDYFLSFLSGLGINPKLLIWIADIEWIDLEAGAFTFIEKTMDKGNFMSQIRNQCGLIHEDLQSRGVEAEVKLFLEIFPEDIYLAEEVKQKKSYIQLLETSGMIRKSFDNILKLERRLYERQCGPTVNPHNPHPVVRDALIRDIVSHLAPLQLLEERYANHNHLFFLQSGPFTQFYKDACYVSWRINRLGAF